MEALAEQHIHDLGQKAAELLAMKVTLQHLVHCCHGDDGPDCSGLEGLCAAFCPVAGIVHTAAARPLAAPAIATVFPELVAPAPPLLARRLRNPSFSFSFGRVRGGGNVEIDRAIGFDLLGSLPVARQADQARFDGLQRRAASAFLDHAHADEMTQMAMGMMGSFIVHPENPLQFRVERDFEFLLAADDITPGSALLQVNTMLNFNPWIWNSRVFPGAGPTGRPQRRPGVHPA